VQEAEAAVPPVQTDPDGQGKHPVAFTKSPALQDVGVTQAFEIMYCPGVQTAGGAEPPAQAAPAGQVVQYVSEPIADVRMYEPAAQTVEPSQTQLERFAFGTLPVPHKIGRFEKD